MTSSLFATVARLLTDAARSAGVGVPGFRSPPRHPDLDRCLRGRGDDAVVSVRIRGRVPAAVVADMVEGVVVANELDGASASRLRAALWDAIAAAGVLEAFETAPVVPLRRHAA